MSSINFWREKHEKKFIAFSSFVIVLSLLISITGSAIAAPLGGGPTISAPSGGGSATLTTIAISKLPGTEANAAGTLFPQGHTNGDLMFSGDGVQVSGLVGYATLSMPLANYTAGWNGSIYQWLNENWVKIPTTVTQDAESADGTASATIYSDGIYALIISYKAPVTDANEKCKSFEFSSLSGGYFPPSGIFITDAHIIGNFNIDGLVGKSYPYSVISLDPSIHFSGDATGRVFVTAYSSLSDGLTLIVLEFSDGAALVSHDGELNYPPFIFRVFINGCRIDYTVYYN